MKEMLKSSGLFLSVLVFSLLVNAVVHDEAVDSALRYARVAEGNISHSVYTMWSEGLSGYLRIVESDMQGAGRVRPVHWLFHSVPFFLTLAGNGDLFWDDPGQAWFERINGDLLVHTWFLLFCASLSATALAWVGFRATGSKGFLLLFPILIVSGSAYLSRNLIFNFCDSGEVGQLMFISLHMLALSRALQGAPCSRAADFGGFLCLVLALFMKETTLVYTAALFVALCLSMFLLRRSEDPCRMKWFLRQILLLAIASLVLVVMVLLNRSGQYSGNYQAATMLHQKISGAWENISIVSAQIKYVFLGTVFLAVGALLSAEVRSAIRKTFSPGLFVLGLALLLFAGFWLINLPWPFQLIKYYWPSYVFLAFGVSLCLLVGFKLLRALSLKPAAWLWLGGSLVLLGWNIPESAGSVKDFYKERYEIRKTVLRAVDDMASVPMHAETVSVQLSDGGVFPERKLQFCRLLNRAYRINIAAGDRVVERIGAWERHYFRRHIGAPAVDIGMLSADLANLRADYAYIWAYTVEDEESAMRERGYRLVREWSAGVPGTRVGVYQKQ